MKLFDVPAGKRVRITSKLIRWVERRKEQVLGENLTWEGTTTDKYFTYKGALRRLLVDHTIDYPEYGTWQKNVECEVLDDDKK